MQIIMRESIINCSSNVKLCGMLLRMQKKLYINCFCWERNRWKVSKRKETEVYVEWWKNIAYSGEEENVKRLRTETKKHVQSEEMQIKWSNEVTNEAKNSQISKKLCYFSMNTISTNRYCCYITREKDNAKKK